ncbi:hypothetical protein [Hahella chejuensis]|uniref:hypothetical protein n=1 Tax=Hahella chejuensis TaxID=158327 RepID=UPI0005A17CB0|nr:hypothetical protein [Hahella chejuensis]
MKYRVSKENIEFKIDDESITRLVRAVLKVVVPSKFNKLYFLGIEGYYYPDMNEMKNSGLVVLTESNHSTLIKRERLIHRHGCAVLVPSLNGIVKHNEWQPVCERIASEYREIV